MGFVSKVFLLVATMLLMVMFAIYIAVSYIMDLFGMSSSTSRPTDLRRNWWGPEAEAPEASETGIWQRPDDDVASSKFTVSVSDKELDNLRQSLRQTVYPAPLEGANFEYGFNADYLKRVVVEHWLNKYNWRQQQAWINSFDHWTTRIDGLRVHYVHVKPTPRKPSSAAAAAGAGLKVIPIVLIHGWPGSFVEFLKLATLLADTASSENDLAYELVIPSIPGYGFSEAPHKPGFGPVEAATMFDALMRRLGHDAYYVQGGDWGSIIAESMAQLFPDRVRGLHVNFLSELNKWIVFKAIVGRFVPRLVGIDDVDYAILYPRDSLVEFLFQETGYMHIQATKPDTVGMGLANSPAGLAAYILEKFAICTDKSGVRSFDGKLTDKFTLDQLLDNVMIYWMTGCMTSAMRLYKEYFMATKRATVGRARKIHGVPVTVPTGVASFPNECVAIARMAAETKYPNLVSFTRMARGGHFGAMEEPHLMAEELRRFVIVVESAGGVSNNKVAKNE